MKSIEHNFLATTVWEALPACWQSSGVIMKIEPKQVRVSFKKNKFGPAFFVAQVDKMGVTDGKCDVLCFGCRARLLADVVRKAFS